MLVRFLRYVEIQTKLASVLPFLLGLAYAWLVYGRIQPVNTLLFFTSMLCFDMATTALNNYTDSRTNGIPLGFRRPVARLILLFLLALATTLGLWLAWLAGWIVLAAGALCFAVGILYTFGPAPISRMPLGELFSGVFMGFFIPFLAVLCNSPADPGKLPTAPAPVAPVSSRWHELAGLLSLNGLTENLDASHLLTPAGVLLGFRLDAGVLHVAFNITGLLRLLLLTIVPVCTIANIMLANNICDVDHDRLVHRFTLPYYIGRPWALRLFAALYYLAFAAIAALVAWQILPLYGLAALAVAPLIQINLTRFRRQQVKRLTFALSVQNFVWINSALILVTALAAWQR